MKRQTAGEAERLGFLVSCQKAHGFSNPDNMKNAFLHVTWTFPGTSYQKQDFDENREALKVQNKA